MFGSDELALEKQVLINSLNDEVAILQKQHDAAKSEELEIERY